MFKSSRSGNYRLPGSALLLILVSLLAGLAGCMGNYGQEVKKDYLQVFYQPPVTKEQAQATLDFLHPQWRTEGDATGKKSVQLTRSGDTVNFRMVTDPARMGTLTEDAMGAFIQLMSDSLFNHAPVNLVLCDNKFKEVRRISYKDKFRQTLEGMPLSTESYGVKFTAGNIEVFAKDGVDGAKATALAEYLDGSDGGSTDTKSFQLENAGSGYIVKMVTSPQVSATQPDAAFTEMANLLSRDVFNGARVKLVLANNQFVDFKEFPSDK